MSATWQIGVERENRRIRARAGRAIIQLLFTRPDGLSVERLRQLLREGFRECPDAVERAVASLDLAELISSIVEIDVPLGKIGLHVEVINGFARLVTLPVQPEDFAKLLGSDSGAYAEIIPRAAVEVLAAVALRQPVTPADLALWFDADKRSQLERLQNLGLIDKIKGADGRVHFATTGEFLRRFKLKDHQALLQFQRDAGGANAPSQRDAREAPHAESKTGPGGTGTDGE